MESGIVCAFERFFSWSWRRVENLTGPYVDRKDSLIPAHRLVYYVEHVMAPIFVVTSSAAHTWSMETRKLHRSREWRMPIESGGIEETTWHRSSNKIVKFKRRHVCCQRQKQRKNPTNSAVDPIVRYDLRSHLILLQSSSQSKKGEGGIIPFVVARLFPEFWFCKFVPNVSVNRQRW